MALRAHRKSNMTQASTRYMPTTDYMWLVASGATHSRNWFTAGLQGSRRQLAIVVTAHVLDFCDSAEDALDGYVGPADFDLRGNVRRRGLLARSEGWDPAAPTAGYDDYALRDPHQPA
jgi:hypothetical protein